MRRWRRRFRTWSGALVATGLLVVALMAQPVAGVDAVPGLAGPSLPLPSLPVPTLPPLPVPTLPPLPVPTLPPLPTPTALPTLPPVPTLPVPTPSLPLPSGSFLPSPLPSLLPTGSLLPTPGPGGPSGSPPPTPSDPGPAGSGTLLIALVSAAPSGDPTVPASGPLVPDGQGRSPFDFGVPGLIIGVPIALVVLFVMLQVAGGAAWLPVVRRWLGRGL